MGLTIATVVLVGIVLLGYAIVIYNRLVALRNRFKNAYAQIDVQLQRRYELVPNLVEIAKRYLAHEQSTLENVIAARNQAQTAARTVGQNPANAGALAALAGAEHVLEGALSKLFALVEAYPDLKADGQLAQLHEELVSTENRVGFARQAFNDAVMFYNTRRESFPDVLLANAFGFGAANLLVLEDGEARGAMRVSLA